MKNLTIFLFILSIISCRKEEDENDNLAFVDFTYSKGSSPNTIIFTAQPSAQGSITWEFGDGSSATGSVVSHTYSAHGIYNVTSRLSSSAGNASRTKRINASGKTKMTITGFEAVAPTLNLSGLPWDTESGETAPDIFVRAYDPLGNELLPGSPVYFNNTFSVAYNLNQFAEITNFDMEMTLKVFDHDATSNELIGRFKFTFLLTLDPGPFTHTYTLPLENGLGSLKMSVVWS